MQDPVPIINPVDDLQECDNADDGDFANGIIQAFNLKIKTAGVLGTQDPAIFTVSYHLTFNDAQNGTNCERAFEIEVQESIIATLTEDNVLLEDETDQSSIRIIDPNLLGIGDYEYALEDEEGQTVRPY